MKSLHQFKWLASVAVATALCSAPVAASPVLSIVPSASAILVGGSVTLDVRISGVVTAGQVVSGFDLDLLYSPLLLGSGVLNTAPGESALGGVSGLPPIVTLPTVPTPGTMGATMTSFLIEDDDLASIQSDDFILMQITLTGLTNGAAFVNFGADPDFQRLVTGRLDLDGVAVPLSLTYIGTCIAIGTGTCDQAIPEPGTYALAGVALAALGATRVRRRRVPASAT